MTNLVIMPTENRERMNLGEFAEEATIIEETATPKRVNHFIEANTQEATLQHLKNDCITPVFAKDNELTVNHAAFIETVWEAANSYYNGETIGTPDIRVSHVIKGRIPEAIHKPANQLLESDKTIYYERAAFSIDIPTIYETVEGNKLNLSIVGVRAYNQMNLYSKKVPELFRLAIGFKNQVCCNMCIFTDGYKDDLRVSNTSELYRSALELFNNYNPAKHIYLMQQLGNTSMSEHQFCQIIGRMRLYQALTPNQQKRLPRLLLGDSQINAACRAFVSDVNFKSTGDSITGWQLLNPLNGSVKSSYIDNFLERNLNCTEFVQGIQRAKLGDSEYAWFLG